MRRALLIAAMLAFTPAPATARHKVRWNTALASWYGPGLYGNGLACGGTLSEGQIGVAHKTLPCGTKLRFKYRGRYVTAKVIDRGPYVSGRDFDLTEATKNRLGCSDLCSLKWRKVRR